MNPWFYYSNRSHTKVFVDNHSNHILPIVISIKNVLLLYLICKY